MNYVKSYKCTEVKISISHSITFKNSLMQKTLLIILGLMITAISYSQSIKSYVITSAGTSVMSSEGAIYLSIGEPMNTELTDGEIMISQGFLNVTLTGLVDTEDLLEEDIRIYPNPTVANLTLSLDTTDGDYEYHIYNQSGELIRKQIISSDSEDIDFSSYSSGLYFMKVTKENKYSRTVKITKL